MAPNHFGQFSQKKAIQKTGNLADFGPLRHQCIMRFTFVYALHLSLIWTTSWLDKHNGYIAVTCVGGGGLDVMVMYWSIYWLCIVNLHVWHYSCIYNSCSSAKFQQAVVWSHLCFNKPISCNHSHHIQPLLIQTLSTIIVRTEMLGVWHCTLFKMQGTAAMAVPVQKPARENRLGTAMGLSDASNVLQQYFPQCSTRSDRTI